MIELVNYRFNMQHGSCFDARIKDIRRSATYPPGHVHVSYIPKEIILPNNLAIARGLFKEAEGRRGKCTNE
jgi:hypothetical protein